MSSSDLDRPSVYVVWICTKRKKIHTDKINLKMPRNIYLYLECLYMLVEFGISVVALIKCLISIKVFLPISVPSFVVSVLK